MKSPKIIYLITRAHGLKTHLLEPMDLNRILKARDLREINSLLSRSDYSTDLSELPIRETRADLFERIFYRKLSERLSLTVQIADGRVKETLEEYYKKIEVENIKRIINAIHGGEKINEESLIPVPRKYQIVNFSALLEAHDIREMIDLLRATPYRGLRNKIDLYERYNNPLILEMQTEQILYNSLWHKLSAVPNEDEVEELIGTEIDLKNLMSIVFFKNMKMEQELIEEMLVDIRYRLTKDLIQQLIAASLETMPRLLSWPAYVDLTRKALELLDKEMFAEIEHVFSQYIYSYAETEMLRKPNNLVYVFSYLYLCFREARNLTTLITGKQLRLDEEKIQSFLFL
jgi:vacuolar-type H+-ATPase subunit C/Vma6